MSGSRKTRTPAAKAWQRLYGTAQWQALRKAQLTKQPLCERCLSNGRVTAATVAHHKEPHRGDEQKFFHGELSSSCAPCHDSIEQSIERLGFEKGCDRSGWPINPDHHFNSRK